VAESVAIACRRAADLAGTSSPDGPAPTAEAVESSQAVTARPTLPRILEADLIADTPPLFVIDP
jgi:hypothetical protein